METTLFRLGCFDESNGKEAFGGSRGKHFEVVECPFYLYEIECGERTDICHFRKEIGTILLDCGVDVSQRGRSISVEIHSRRNEDDLSCFGGAAEAGTL